MDDQICTKESPMPANAPGRWAHKNVEERDGLSDYILYYKCLNCGKEFECEMPD